MLSKTTEYGMLGQLSKLYNLGYAKGRYDAAEALYGDLRKTGVNIKPTNEWLTEIEQFLKYDNS